MESDDFVEDQISFATFARPRSDAGSPPVKKRSRLPARNAGGTHRKRTHRKSTARRAADPRVPTVCEATVGAPLQVGEPSFLRKCFDKSRRLPATRPTELSPARSSFFDSDDCAFVRVVPAPALPAPFADHYLRACWPCEVLSLRHQFNPAQIKFPFVAQHRACACEGSCRSPGCPNARDGIYCRPGNCPFSGMCGNGLKQSTKLRLARNARTGEFLVVATEHIAEGEVVAEYLGQLKEVYKGERVLNTGYRLLINEKPIKSKAIAVAIDAEIAGCISRFMNHACVPVARFQLVARGHKRTAVVATLRSVAPGEEITVNYGSNLWFICRCGHVDCQHRDLQHLDTVPAHVLHTSYGQDAVVV